MRRLTLAVVLVLLFCVSSVATAADKITITIAPEGEASETFSLSAPAGTLTQVIAAFADKGWTNSTTDADGNAITKVQWFAIALKNFALSETRNYLKREATRAAVDAVDQQADQLNAAISVEN